MLFFEILAAWYLIGFFIITIWDFTYHKTSIKTYFKNIRTVILFSFLGPLLFVIFAIVKRLATM
jgi:hypothetical protein